MPQNQRTDPVSPTDFSEWQQAAIVDYATHGNGCKAWRDHYPNQTTERTIQVESSKFFRRPDVRATINDLRDVAWYQHGLSFAEYIQGQVELRDLSVLSGNMGAAVNAWTQAGRASGHHDGEKEASRPKTSELESILEKIESAKGVATQSARTLN